MKNKLKILPLLLLLSLLLTGCTAETTQAAMPSTSAAETAAVTAAAEVVPDEAIVTLDTIPAFTDQPYVVINGNQPFFTEGDLTTETFETYSALDDLGRCGVAFANVCLETMPTEERGSISQVKPSGWQSIQYDFVDGKSLYNRCHLIGFQLTAENANECNLITGTRYLNVQGMLPFENLVADYVKETENHVLYRVTPLFTGDNLVADGVLMEAYSVEDDGDGICFCVYAYNNQPGVTINYATGESQADGTIVDDVSETIAETVTETTATTTEETQDYVLNTRSKKFHLPTCSGVSTMRETNRQDFTGTREELIAQGYEACGICKP
jgi:DNA-entry nuclease